MTSGNYPGQSQHLPDQRAFAIMHACHDSKSLKGPKQWGTHLPQPPVRLQMAFARFADGSGLGDTWPQQASSTKLLLGHAACLVPRR